MGKASGLTVELLHLGTQGVQIFAEAMFLPVHGRGDSGSGLAIAQSTQAFQFTLDEHVINVDWKVVIPGLCGFCRSGVYSDM